MGAALAEARAAHAAMRATPHPAPQPLQGPRRAKRRAVRVDYTAHNLGGQRKHVNCSCPLSEPRWSQVGPTVQSSFSLTAADRRCLAIAAGALCASVDATRPPPPRPHHTPMGYRKRHETLSKMPTAQSMSLHLLARAREGANDQRS